MGIYETLYNLLQDFYFASNPLTMWQEQALSLASFAIVIGLSFTLFKFILKCLFFWK